ncbi:PREDICTED: uncharacterized protein LOC109473764 [Branchiostoma belcheri]|uniref:Uncharacterized protein LOC109473764 n=1 Tax=Branchiostoma belcheri TaxID=7741 RepID=A0A6P4YYK5_BRABE|nr:PREDICTED: uncharacterized protein LOC109473764 [Branchiostoma belcheri]
MDNVHLMELIYIYQRLKEIEDSLEEAANMIERCLTSASHELDVHLQTVELLLSRKYMEDEAKLTAVLGRMEDLLLIVLDYNSMLTGMLTTAERLLQEERELVAYARDIL